MGLSWREARRGAVRGGVLLGRGAGRGPAGEPSRTGRQEDRGTGIPRPCQPGLNLRTGSVISVLGELGKLPLLLSFFICKAGMAG